MRGISPVTADTNAAHGPCRYLVKCAGRGSWRDQMAGPKEPRIGIGHRTGEKALAQL